MTSVSLLMKKDLSFFSKSFSGSLCLLSICTKGIIKDQLCYRAMALVINKKYLFCLKWFLSVDIISVYVQVDTTPTGIDDISTLPCRRDFVVKS